jgi:hypothetical protein
MLKNYKTMSTYEPLQTESGEKGSQINENGRN